MKKENEMNQFENEIKWEKKQKWIMCWDGYFYIFEIQLISVNNWKNRKRNQW